MSKMRVVDVDQLRELVEVQKLQQWKVADIMGLPRKKMTKFCHRYGIQTQRTGPRAAEGHPGWKGGRLLDEDGYVLVYTPGHPFARFPKRKYVLEHRLVMEAAIGRYLDPDEVVHHKGPDKADNRIENLVLYSQNSEHLRDELTGKCPKWSPEGKQRILDSVRKLGDTRKGLTQDAYRML